MAPHRTRRAARRSPSRCITLVAAGLLTALAGGGLRAQEQVVELRVDGADVGREFFGVGAISAGANARLLIDYPEPARSEILDCMFRPGHGAALQILKVEMGGGSNTTVGSDPTHARTPDEVDCSRGYQWWLMREAKKRNPDITLIAQQWTAPGWLDGIWTQDNIDYHLSWLECAEKNGVQVDWIGGWNEKGYDVDWFIEFDKALAEHFPDIRIPAADDNSDIWAVARSMAENPRFKEAIDAVAVHWPFGWRTHYREASVPQYAQDLGDPLWLSANAGMGHDVGGMPNARGINRMYTDGQMSLYLIWNCVETWYAHLPIGDSGLMQARWPWSGYYELGKNVWALAHTTQFTQVGWHYLDTGSARLDNGATCVTMVSPSGEDYSMIVEAMDLQARSEVAVQLDNLPPQVLHHWVSELDSDDPDDYFRYRGTIVPHDGRFELVLQPGQLVSITSTTGQGRTSAERAAQLDASPHELFPLPFEEDFEDVDHGRLAPFFADMNGEWEAVPAGGGRDGTAYQQMLTMQPVTWIEAGTMPPTTMVGDPRWDGNYELAAAVLLDQPGYVELIGRCTGHRDWRADFGGYHFQIGSDGWQLYSEDPASQSVTELIAGDERLEPGTWHDLALRMNDRQITMLLDGEVIGSLVDDHERAGNVALRASKWINAQFDDVRITPVGKAPRFVPRTEVSVAHVSSAQGFWKGWTFDADFAIDGRPETRWQTENGPRPHAITLDLGRERNIQGLWLRPRFNRTNAMITGYRIELSRDGRSFQSVAEGGWAATAATKVASWEPQRARFLRLVATAHMNRQASAAEIDVVLADD